MERRYLKDDEIRAMLFEYEDESAGSNESYISADDGNQVDMIRFDPESDYNSFDVIILF